MLSETGFIFILISNLKEETRQEYMTVLGGWAGMEN